MIEAGPKVATSPDTAPYQYQYHGVVARIGGNRHKYVVRGSNARELYDLDADPTELVNRAGQAEYAQQEAPLDALITAYQWCTGVDCR